MSERMEKMAVMIGGWEETGPAEDMDSEEQVSERKNTKERMRL